MPDPIVQPGDRISLTIDRLAYGGEGVGRYEGLTVFVGEVCPGETVNVEVTEVKPRFARARLREVERAAPERVPALCPIYGECGGCQLQHLDYPAQVASKTDAVRDAMRRLGRLPDIEVRDCIPSPLPFGYRNKIELAATTDEHGRIALAYHTVGDDRYLVPVHDCPLALPEVNGLLEAVLPWLNDTGWPPYDLEKSTGLVREVGLRFSTSTREANMMLISGRRDLPDKAHWVERLRAALPELVGVRHRARTRASQSPHGRTVSARIGRPLHVKLGELSLRVSPDAFFQVNEWMLGPLADVVIAALEPRRDDIVADLYAGVGTFGLAVANAVREVVLLEVDPDAIDDAEANVKFNRLENVRIEHGQVEQKLSWLSREVRPTKLILDPPRQGLSDAVLRIAVSAKPRGIAYVSCDPTTLARDLGRFAAAGYRTQWVQPLDLFPQTYHVESVASLVRA